MSPRKVARASRSCAIAIVLLTVPLLGTTTAAAAGPTVIGAGSTWSQVAIEQWRSDVARQGLAINYTGVGSTAGRQYYINEQVDFAVSEIPFLPDEVKTLKGKGLSYQYLPIVAGGTSMMYNLKNASGQIRNLQLSSATIAKIFTGKITKWNDRAIKADNPKLSLPDQSIIPVTRSDGSGTSAQFSAYIDAIEPAIWHSFCTSTSPPISPCGPTSFWPPFGLSVQQRGSDGIANYVANPGLGSGSIGYVETAYAIARNMPVVSVKNASKFYVQPTAQNVAIALTHATLNGDRTQNLGKVYTASEDAAYPISSYSYMITQTTGFDRAKGEVLGKFIEYFVCTGQQSAERLGYSPLPKNLVEASFDAVRNIPGAPPPPALSDCDNPQLQGTFDETGDPGTPEQGGGTEDQTDGGGTKDGGHDPANVAGETGSDIAGTTIEATSAQIAAGTSPSILPLVIAGLVVLLLVFGPLFLKLSRPGGPSG